MDYLISLHFISLSPLDLYHNHFSTHDQNLGALPSTLTKVSNASGAFFSFTGKQTWTCEIFPNNTYYYFSKCGYIFLGIFPLENTVYYWKYSRSKVQLSQVPTFSPKTEPRLKCTNLGCEHEKKLHNPSLNRPFFIRETKV